VWFSEGLGYVDADGNPAGYWPVGYVALLGAFYAIFGTSLTVAFLMNALLGGVTIACTHGLARTLFGPAAGRAAAWIVALLPTLILYTTCIASENAVLPGLLAGVWLMAIPASRAGPEPRAGLRGRLVLDAAAGVVLAATAYVRGTAIPFALMPLALAPRPPSQAIFRASVVAACVVVLLLPWGERNRDAFGTFSLTSINAGANIWMGNHEGTNGMAAELPARHHLASARHRRDCRPPSDHRSPRNGSPCPSRQAQAPPGDAAR
jgi:4-amino-4-deoxy-L-arabinose transferase-like glycosyltransferase